MATLFAISGDETGLLKRVALPEAHEETSESPGVAGVQQRAQGVLSLAWLSGEDDPSDGLFASCHRDGIVRTWEAPAGSRNIESLGAQRVQPEGAGVASAVDLAYLPQHDKLGLVNQEGAVRLFTPPMRGVGEAEPAMESSFEITGPIGAAAWSLAGLAVGGRERDLQVFDLDRGTAAFTAKNVPHDELSLRVPVWITAIAMANAPGNELITGTGHRHVRWYDIRAQRQPILSVSSGDHRVTTLCCVGGDVVVGDTAGELQVLDGRTLRFRRKLKGGAGSVRSLAGHGGRGVVAAVGLDRHLRIYDVRGGEAMAKVYLKQRLNAVLLGRTTSSDRDEDALEEDWDARDEEGIGNLEEADLEDDAVEDLEVEDEKEHGADGAGQSDSEDGSDFGTDEDESDAEEDAEMDPDKSAGAERAGLGRKRTPKGKGRRGPSRDSGKSAGRRQTPVSKRRKL